MNCEKAKYMCSQNPREIRIGRKKLFVKNSSSQFSNFDESEYLQTKECE